MTEAAHQMTSNPLPIKGKMKRKPGTVGIPQGVELRIYDERGEKALSAGEHGDVCIRSPSVMRGYLNNDRANQESFIPCSPAPFFRTGDRGFLDQDGYLTLVGRNSEIINRGGEKISPFEVDAAILGCSPFVREAVSFAVEDDLMGQEVEAAVVLQENSEGLGALEIQRLVARVLADFKIPKKIHFFEKAIPKGV